MAKTLWISFLTDKHPESNCLSNIRFTTNCSDYIGSYSRARAQVIRDKEIVQRMVSGGINFKLRVSEIGSIFSCCCRSDQETVAEFFYFF